MSKITQKCKNCKREIPENAVYCPWCGEKQIREKKKEVSVPKPTHRGNKWTAQLMQDGKRTTVSAATEAEYYAKARAIKAGLLEKETPAPKRTLDSVVQEYIADRSHTLSPATVKGYKYTWAKRFTAYHKKNIADIDWQKMVNAEAEGCDPKTLKNAWGIVSAALRTVGIRPAVSLPPVPKYERPWLTPEQIPLFLQAIRGQPGELPALLALHSLRKGEIMGLRWEDISGDVIHVHAVKVVGVGGLVDKPTPKNPGSDRRVKIVIPRLKELLNAVPEAERVGEVVHGNHLKYSVYIRDCCAANGLPPVTLHGLRHSFASLCHRLQIPILDVQRQGGWSDYETLRKIYTHLDEQDQLTTESTLEAFYYKITTDNQKTK